MPTTYPNEQPEHRYTLASMGGEMLKNFASFFCGGCGYGVVGHLLTKLYEDLHLDPMLHPVVIGIGCYTQITTLLHDKAQKLATLHGRAPAIVTGIKLANPAMKPVLLTGDGDCYGIGGNHFLHLCRRNLDCIVLVFNNGIYGMTGGQVAPTTPVGSRTMTTSGTVFERPVDGVKLAIAAGASHVARTTVAHPRTFMKYFKKALRHKGTSIIEVLTPCVTYFGRKNEDEGGGRMDTGGALLDWIKGRCVWENQARTMTPAELAGKYIIGEFLFDPSVPEYASEYEKVKARAMGARGP